MTSHVVGGDRGSHQPVQANVGVGIGCVLGEGGYIYRIVADDLFYVVGVGRRGGERGNQEKNR